VVKVGFHVSIAGGIDKAFDRAIARECNTFQIFTRNPRTWRSRELEKVEIDRFQRKREETKIYPIFAHMPYIQNLSSPVESVYERSVKSLLEEFRRCSLLGIPYVVTHLGSHLGTCEGKAVDRVVEGIKTVLQEDFDVGLLLENTAGSPNQIGSNFDDLNSIFVKVNDQRVGLCFDTCHAFVAGMNIGTEKGLEFILTQMQKIIGFNRLKLVHLNDSKNECGSHNDKHEHIGLGKIGVKGFRRIIKSELGRYPMIMETPVDDREDIDNMRMVRRLAV
jgi:deoxyribonuclease-4